MADITIKIDKKEAEEFLKKQRGEKKPQATMSLNVRKTIDGNLIAYDHEDIDIVVMPSEKKVIAFPTDLMGDHVYGAMNRLFDYLTKKGVIKLDSVQGGNIYGSLEAIIPDSELTNPIQMCLFIIGKFIEEERPYFEYAKANEEQIEDMYLEPTEEDSTDFETAISKHADDKGAIKPNLLYGLAQYRLMWE